MRLAIITKAVNPCPAEMHGSKCSKEAGHDGAHGAVYLDEQQNRRFGRRWP